LPLSIAGVGDTGGRLPCNRQDEVARGMGAVFFDLPPLQRRHFQRENLRMVQTKREHEMPRGKKFTVEQITGKLREAEVELARGKTVP
jgi:hypothetical protein